MSHQCLLGKTANKNGTRSLNSVIIMISVGCITDRRVCVCVCDAAAESQNKLSGRADETEPVCVCVCACVCVKAIDCDNGSQYGPCDSARLAGAFVFD